ncbi:mrna 3 -end-processing yth1 [Fusarium longipes]|uniref:Mrna 3-end-processing yth1 n=1 Tax=Fusarium longipes TaxID=694270 RepID=A0A395SA56_9HYPO|nr:mrna 3 -end-processing yth1 [Fusarium longipes]
MTSLISPKKPDDRARDERSSPEATAEHSNTETGLLPPQHWAQLSEDIDGHDDTDSTIPDNASSTASLTSSILKYRTVHGRLYHSERGNTDYWGPIDETGRDAMDINHHVLTLLMGDKLHLAPLSEDIQAAADIGTGTGIWAIEFADKFPNASVVGTDLAPIQPSWVPPNLEFQIDDCTQEWTIPPNSLDYVHIRWLVGSITDWTALFKEAYKSLKPGGWIESYEPSSTFESDNNTVLPGSAMNQWQKFFVEGGRKIGRPFTVFEDGIQRKAMQEAGFVDIEEKVFKNPIGGWPKDPEARSIGEFTQAALEQDGKGTVLHMATALGWSEEEVTVFMSHFRREIRSPKIHAYFKQRAIWGRKPEAS